MKVLVVIALLTSVIGATPETKAATIAQEKTVVVGTFLKDQSRFQLTDVSGTFDYHHLPSQFEGYMTLNGARIPVVVSAYLPDFSAQFVIQPKTQDGLNRFLRIILSRERNSQRQKLILTYPLTRENKEHDVQYSISR